MYHEICTHNQSLNFDLADTHSHAHSLAHALKHAYAHSPAERVFSTMPIRHFPTVYSLERLLLLISRWEDGLLDETVSFYAC